MSITYQKAEIVNIDLGKIPNEIKGHEQANLRPCLVIKPFNSLKLLTVLPITSKEPKYSLFSIVKLQKASGGLSSDSYVLCHQIRTVSIDRNRNKRGKLDSKDFLKVQAVLLDVLEL